MVSDAALSSVLAGFSAVATGAIVGLGVGSAFVAGWDGGVGELGGRRATSPSRLHDARNVKERLRLTSRVRDMMLFLCWIVVIVRP
jgi:hypothetical protein